MTSNQPSNVDVHRCSESTQHHHVLLVSGSAQIGELFANAMREQLGVMVVWATPDRVSETLTGCSKLDLAVIELQQPTRGPNGIDVLLSVRSTRPRAKLALLAGADAVGAQILRDAWELFDIAGVLSTRNPVAHQLELLYSLLRGERIKPDESLRPWLPGSAGSRMKRDGLLRLVEHAGHAKLWKALIDCDCEPSYNDLTLRTGLKLNTVRNYREQLLPELRRHGLGDATLRDMWSFAQRVRSLLAPVADAKLSYRASA